MLCETFRLFDLLKYVNLKVRAERPWLKAPRAERSANVGDPPAVIPIKFSRPQRNQDGGLPGGGPLTTWRRTNDVFLRACLVAERVDRQIEDAPVDRQRIV